MDGVDFKAGYVRLSRMTLLNGLLIALFAFGTVGLFKISAHAKDSQPPTVEVTAPKAGMVVHGTFTLRALAADNVGVTRTKWYVDGKEVAWDGSRAPWTHLWNTTKLANGSHRVFAKAADAADNWATSSVVEFTVKNPASPRTQAAGTHAAGAPTTRVRHLTLAAGVRPAGPCGTRRTTFPRYQHVVWIVMENKTFSDVIDSPNAPYINSMARKCGLATDFHAESHPSLPNYIAMTSGDTQGITDDADPSSHALSVPSIFSQLGASGWRALIESMPSNCSLSNSGLYAVRHNPAVYYTNLRTACTTRDVPLRYPLNLSAKLTIVIPNTCNDMHSCPTASDSAAQVRNGDGWLSRVMPRVFASRQYRAGSTVVFITWDEDDYHHDQHIPTLVISPSTRPGTKAIARFDHYSLLRTTSDLLDLHISLGAASSALSMKKAFHL